MRQLPLPAALARDLPKRGEIGMYCIVFPASVGWKLQLSRKENRVRFVTYSRYVFHNTRHAVSHCIVIVFIQLIAPAFFGGGVLIIFDR